MTFEIIRTVYDSEAIRHRKVFKGFSKLWNITANIQAEKELELIEQLISIHKSTFLSIFRYEFEFLLDNIIRNETYRLKKKLTRYQTAKREQPKEMLWKSNCRKHTQIKAYCFLFRCSSIRTHLPTIMKVYSNLLVLQPLLH